MLVVIVISWDVMLSTENPSMVLAVEAIRIPLKFVCGTLGGLVGFGSVVRVKLLEEMTTVDRLWASSDATRRPWCVKVIVVLHASTLKVLLEMKTLPPFVTTRRAAIAVLARW